MNKKTNTQAELFAQNISRFISTPIVAVSALALGTYSAAAQSSTPTMEDIGVLDDGAPFTQSDAAAVSGDGSVAVGVSSNASGDPRAIMYSGGTMTDLTSSFSPNNSRATGTNDDGTVISGSITPVGASNAFYWTQGTGAVQIPTIAGTNSAGNGVSGDGTQIVGTIFGGGTSVAYDQAFVWSVAANTYVTIPGLIANGATRGNDISDDGTIVVGRAQTSAIGPNHAFRAVVGGAITDLGTIGGATGTSQANGVSGDGLVVVGQSVAPSVTGQRAFRWSAGTGMVELQSTDEANVTFSLANAASEDGAFVAGAALYSTTPGYRALRWDSNGVATDLGDLTTNNDGTSFANGISADGSVVVGVASTDGGSNRGFIWRDAVQPGGTMLDHINTLTQVSNSAAQQAAGAHQLDALVQFALDESLEISRGLENGPSQRAKTSALPYSMRVVAAAANNPDANNTAVGVLVAAVGLRNDLSLGGHIGFGGDSDSLAGYGIDGNFLSYGAYLRQGSQYGEGLNWKVAAARTSADVDITRSTVLPNTEQGTGTSDLSAQAASVELGYGLRKGSMVVVPFLRLSRSVVQRDGYTETGSVAFPVTYDDYEIASTIATIGTNISMPVSDAGVVKFSAGLEWDLSRSSNSVTGTSDIPGMTDFAIAGPSLEHNQRLFAEARYVHTLSAGRSYDLGLGVQQTPYSDKPSVMASIGYQMDF